MASSKEGIPYDVLKSLVAYKPNPNGVVDEFTHVYNMINKDDMSKFITFCKEFPGLSKRELADKLEEMNQLVRALHKPDWVCEPDQEPVELNISSQLSLEDLTELSSDIRKMIAKTDNGQAGNNASGEAGWRRMLTSGAACMVQVAHHGMLSEKDLKHDKGKFCPLVAYAKQAGRLSELLAHADKMELVTEEVRDNLKYQIHVASHDRDNAGEGFGRDMSNKFQVDYLYVTAIFCKIKKIPCGEAIDALCKLACVSSIKPLTVATMSELFKIKGLSMFSEVSSKKLTFYDNPFLLNRQRLAITASFLGNGISERVIGPQAGQVEVYVGLLLELKREYKMEVDPKPETSSFYEYQLHKTLTTSDPRSIFMNRTKVKKNGLRTVRISTTPKDGGEEDVEFVYPFLDEPEEVPKDTKPKKEIKSEKKIEEGKKKKKAPEEGLMDISYDDLVKNADRSKWIANIAAEAERTRLFKEELERERKVEQERARELEEALKAFEEEDKKRKAREIEFAKPEAHLTPPKQLLTPEEIERVTKQEKALHEMEVLKTYPDNPRNGLIIPFLEEGELEMCTKQLRAVWSNEAIQALIDKGTKLAFIDIEGTPLNPLELSVVVVQEDSSGQDYAQCILKHYPQNVALNVTMAQESKFCHGLTNSSLKKSVFVSDKSPGMDLQSIISAYELKALICQGDTDIKKFLGVCSIPILLVDACLPIRGVLSSLSATEVLNSIEKKCQSHTGNLDYTKYKNVRHVPHCAMGDAYKIAFYVHVGYHVKNGKE